ncbi:hypothetical protein M405DRAFT_882040 [Rhizopogon salebrosus TDB-379]|nr:hypothetical protein M405DRAFT_882040 [Rhizopogon salebrosus TDB-379]
MNFTPTPAAYKLSFPPSLLSNSLYNSSTLLSQDESLQSTPEMNTPSPLCDNFGLPRDPFLDAPPQNNVQPQPLIGSSSWNKGQSFSQAQSAYMRPSDQIQSLLADNERLRHENVVLAVGKAAIEEMLQKLVTTLNSQPCITTQQHNIQQRPSIDHSKLRFYTSTQFNKWLKTADADMKELGQFPFLEDMNGQPLSREKKSAILITMRDLWRGFKIQNKAPRTWRKSDPSIQETFRKEMYSKHPELALCADNWKIDFVATERYPSWASTHLKDRKMAVKSNVIKSEESPQSSENDKNKLTLSDVKPSNKRPPLTLPSNDEATHSLPLAKKPKLVDVTSDSESSSAPLTPSLPVADVFTSYPIIDVDAMATIPDQHVGDSDNHPNIDAMAVISDQDQFPMTDSRPIIDAVTAIPDQSPVDMDVIATTTSIDDINSSGASEVDFSLGEMKCSTNTTSAPITMLTVKNPLDALNSKRVRPLPRMIPTASTTSGTPSATTPTSALHTSNTSPIPPPPTSSTSNIAATPSITNAKRMRPGPNKNGRTLCAHRWLNGVAKEGTATDFKIYWTALPKETKEKYELEAAQLVASCVWNGNTADIISKVSNGTVY